MVIFNKGGSPPSDARVGGDQQVLIFTHLLSRHFKCFLLCPAVLGPSDASREPWRSLSPDNTGVAPGPEARSLAGLDHGCLRRACPRGDAGR